MPRWSSRLTPIFLLALLIPAASLAQAAPAPSHPRHWHWRECLSILDLTDQQKTDIQAVLEAARPTLEADAAAVRSAREALRTAAGAVPPDVCLVGNAYLALRSARQTLHDALESVRGQVMAVLTPEQQLKLEGCLEAPRDATGNDLASDEASD